MKMSKRTTARKAISIVLSLAIVIIMVASLGMMTASAISAWAPNTAYNVGDQVTYNGSTYQCLQAHTSLVGWEPPNVPALWQLVTGGSTSTPTPTLAATSTPTPTSAATSTPTPTPAATLTPTPAVTSTPTPTIAVSSTPTPTPTPTPVPTATPTPGATATPTPISNSIYSVAASSIPAPTGNGIMTFSVMNGTNGAYTNDKVYWGIFGINQATGNWCYLDLNGNLVPLTSALNDASGHLTKNGANYANVFYTISQKQWISLPKMSYARMYLSVGNPCYIKTYDNGYTWPDVNNTSDPNRDIYFDFVEFTTNDTGYHGNTTRVDGFGFPIQHRLINKAGNFDRTVGEYESETRSGLFTKYQNEVSNEFKELGTLQSPYRILPPYRGNAFKTGGPYANYYDSYVNQIWSTYTSKYLTFTCWDGTYSGHVVGNDFVFNKNGGAYNIYIHGKPTTLNILEGSGNLISGTADEKTVGYQLCAAFNRHIVDDPANWNNANSLYKSAPANYYSKFWHDHSIDGLAYGFCFDDSLAAYLDVGDPKGLLVRVGW